MITFDQALGVARERKAATRVASYAGGRTRRTIWVEVGDTIEVILYSTVIASFSAEGVRVYTGGFNTASTFEALNATLGLSKAFYTEKFVPYYAGTRMSEGMLIDYTGRVVATTTDLTPERKRVTR